jgi:hypothetical protein
LNWSDSLLLLLLQMMVMVGGALWPRLQLSTDATATNRCHGMWLLLLTLQYGQGLLSMARPASIMKLLCGRGRLVTTMEGSEQLCKRLSHSRAIDTAKPGNTI